MLAVAQTLSVSSSEGSKGLAHKTGVYMARASRAPSKLELDCVSSWQHIKTIWYGVVCDDSAVSIS